MFGTSRRCGGLPATASICMLWVGDRCYSCGPPLVGIRFRESWPGLARLRSTSLCIWRKAYAWAKLKVRMVRSFAGERRRAVAATCCYSGRRRSESVERAQRPSRFRSAFDAPQSGRRAICQGAAVVSETLRRCVLCSGGALGAANGATPQTFDAAQRVTAQSVYSGGGCAVGLGASHVFVSLKRGLPCGAALAALV